MGKWNQGICNISLEHSKNMGTGKCPYCHDGSRGRMARFPVPKKYHFRSGAENIHQVNKYMAKDRSEVAKRLVDDWIKSKGHEANLVGDFGDCAIAVYFSQQNETWWATQMFAKFEKNKPIKYERY